jgi:hypothetical protein
MFAGLRKVASKSTPLNEISVENVQLKLLNST